MTKADTIFKEFREHSVAEFFKKNRQMLGYSGKIRSLTTIVHEYCTNSLDACEEAGILPEVHVKIEQLGNEHYRVTATDNGPGIPKMHVGRVFAQMLAGTKFHRFVQQRGQQGIGACMPGDVQVPMVDGRVLPIKQLVEDNAVGEMVWALNPETLKIEEEKITKCWKLNNNKLIDIKTSYGREIKLTPENPVLCISGGAIDWKEAQELREGDFIAIPNKIPSSKPGKKPKPLIDYFDKKADSIPTIHKPLKALFKEAGIPLNSDLPPNVYSGLYNGLSRNSFLDAIAILQKNGVEEGVIEWLDTIASSDVKWAKVKSVKQKRNGRDPVYDLEIGKGHNFIANNVLVHNSGCTMYSQITTGKPTKIITSPKKGKIYEAEVMFDVKNNRALVSKEVEYAGDMQGTKVIAEFKDVTFNWSEYSPAEYIRRTAVANPHAKIVFTAPDKQRFVYERAVHILPKQPKPSKPHPRGITVDDLLEYAQHAKERTIKSFLTQTFDRMSSAKADEVEKLTSIDFKRKPDSISWRDAEEIVDAIKKVKFLAPNTANLYPIGEKQIEKAVLNVLEPEFHSVRTRTPSVYRGGVPFIVEVGIAFGGKAGRGSGESAKAEVMRFANRAPLLFDAGGDVITKVVNDIDWKRYSLRKLEETPVTILVNVTSAYVPYTSAGKQAISDEEEIRKEIALALMEVGRNVSSYIRRKVKKGEKAAKRATLLRYVPEVAGAVSGLSGDNKKDLELKLLELVNKKYEEANGDDEPEEEQLPDEKIVENGGGE
ncbi:MAG: DNA topoisomerase VI subunit B [Candidatus Diapherotrites archaeon]|nr:DNA topoisomerase VI subunit B [Candidatus Diapherotrites archaeon]